jgi:non-heme chloroperoxidase
MAFVKVGTENTTDIELYYEDHGSGQPVVLIHGFPFSGRAWERQTPAILDSGRRAITYDRRGFGKSSQPTDGYDYDTFAADLDTLLKTLDLSDVVLIGHSMGTGEIARYLGTYGSERISKAVFISPIPPFLLQTDDNPTGVPMSVFEGIQASIRSDRFKYLDNFLASFYNPDAFLGNRVSKETIRENWIAGSQASPIGTLKCVPAWLTDFREDLPRIDIPALIIHGTEDRILPASSTGGEFLHKAVAKSELFLVDGAPHGVLWTHADDVNKRILEFLG